VTWTALLLMVLASPSGGQETVEERIRNVLIQSVPQMNVAQRETIVSKILPVMLRCEREAPDRLAGALDVVKNGFETEREWFEGYRTRWYRATRLEYPAGIRDQFAEGIDGWERALYDTQAAICVAVVDGGLQDPPPTPDQVELLEAQVSDLVGLWRDEARWAIQGQASAEVIDALAKKFEQRAKAAIELPWVGLHRPLDANEFNKLVQAIIEGFAVEGRNPIIVDNPELAQLFSIDVVDNTSGLEDYSTISEQHMDLTALYDRRAEGLLDVFWAMRYPAFMENSNSLKAVYAEMRAALQEVRDLCEEAHTRKQDREATGRTDHVGSSLARAGNSPDSPFPRPGVGVGTETIHDHGEEWLVALMVLLLAASAVVVIGLNRARFRRS
jgi:hypothetical protein